MADAGLQTELEEFKAEIHRLTERVSSVITPAVHNDWSFIFLAPKLLGTEKNCSIGGIFLQYRRIDPNRKMVRFGQISGRSFEIG